jgi:ribosomal protein S18 acetylase RimI-like enzyme
MIDVNSKNIPIFYFINFSAKMEKAMNFNIRFAKPNDVSGILALIQELAIFENEPDAVDIDEDYLLQHGFGTNKSFYCFVAEDDNNGILGMALFYNRFSTWKGLTIHLEDLIVKEEYRKKGIGKALFEGLIKYAQAEKINRLEWVVLDWNTHAIRFYESYGATVFKEWRTVQMDKDKIMAFKV